MASHGPPHLFEQCTSHHNNTRCAIANLIVLALGELYQQAADLVFHLHLFQDGGAIVGYFV